MPSNCFHVCVCVCVCACVRAPMRVHVRLWRPSVFGLTACFLSCVSLAGHSSTLCQDAAIKVREPAPKFYYQTICIQERKINPALPSLPPPHPTPPLPLPATALGAAVRGRCVWVDNTGRPSQDSSLLLTPPPSLSYWGPCALAVTQSYFI